MALVQTAGRDYDRAMLERLLEHLIEHLLDRAGIRDIV
jgi:hypothetical protein